jgi:HK97 family phage portal protein
MQLQTGIFSDVLSAETERIAAAMAERRSSLENPETPLSYPADWLLDIFNGGRTDAGVRVSEMTALQVVTVLACVDLIGGSLASLPWAPYQRSFLNKSGRAVHTIAYDHDYYDLLSIEPNDEMTQFVMFKAQAIHFLLWGNSYVELQRDGANTAVALWPRNPNKTRPYRLTQATRLEPVAWRPFPVNLAAGTLVYKTTDGVDEQDMSEPGASGYRSERIIPKEDMLHIPGLSLDGRLGQNVVNLARQTIGLALATEKYGAKYFANYARPGGILEVPFPQGSEQWKQAKASWREAQGGENANSVAALPPGFKWTATSDNPEDAQSIETQKLVSTKICSLFHVPPHKVGDVDKGRANTEQLAQEFNTDTLGQWIVAIKQEYKRKLFPNTGVGRTPKNRFYVDCDLWKTVRPDAASREGFYATARNIGGICANDFKEFEGMNPIDEPWAEQHWMPINMTLVETPVDPTHQDGAGNGDQPDNEDDQQGGNNNKKKGKKSASADEKNSRAYVDLYFRMFRDAFGRILTRDKADLRTFTGAFGPVLWSLADVFASEKRGSHGPETDKFLAEYLAAMQKRRATWTDSDDVARAELVRAVKAVRIAVYRDVATQEALAAEKEKPEQIDEG